MTKVYEALKEEPQTEINRGDLKPEERVDLRIIKITKNPGIATKNTPGRYVDVYYLEGDEERAARKFVEENREFLEQIDFSENRNVIQTCTSREIYDLILHEFGERVLEKYPTVVLETRRDGTRWLIDRQKFENNPIRRYSQSDRTAKVPPHIDLRELYDSFENLISANQLELTNIEGDVRQVLDYWRACPDFNCEPTTTEKGNLAIRKLLT